MFLQQMQWLHFGPKSLEQSISIIPKKGNNLAKINGKVA